MTEYLGATPINDNEIPPHLFSVCKGWRMMASALGHNGPVAWTIPPGLWLYDIPKLGPCYQDFNYVIRGWRYHDYPYPTHSVVFWIPKVIELPKKWHRINSGLTGHSDDPTIELRERFQLPAHHLQNFGNAALIAALALGEFHRSGIRTPLDNYWVMTDAYMAGYGGSIRLGHFDDRGLDCDYWGDYGTGHDNFNRADRRNHVMGRFPIGVERLDP
ncbi:MAG: hypothetical protein KBD29_02000 [Candidatus Magasanikbacteria bacterium]|nr:hypothetical protein [Candidatus Magasanikbacteria bacterium]